MRWTGRKNVLLLALPRRYSLRDGRKMREPPGLSGGTPLAGSRIPPQPPEQAKADGDE